MSGSASSTTSPSAHWSVWQVVIGYLVVAAIFIGLILTVLAYGDHFSQTAAVAAETTTKAAVEHKPSVLYHVLLALVSILLLGRWMGKLFVYVGQPRVI